MIRGLILIGGRGARKTNLYQIRLHLLPIEKDIKRTWNQTDVEQKASYNFLETFSKWPFRQRIMQHIMLKAYTVDHMLILGVGLNVNNTQAQTLQFMVECFFFCLFLCSVPFQSGKQ